MTDAVDFIQQAITVNGEHIDLIKIKADSPAQLLKRQNIAKMVSASADGDSVQVDASAELEKLQAWAEARQAKWDKIWREWDSEKSAEFWADVEKLDQWLKDQVSMVQKPVMAYYDYGYDWDEFDRWCEYDYWTGQYTCEPCTYDWYRGEWTGYCETSWSSDPCYYDWNTMSWEGDCWAYDFKKRTPAKAMRTVCEWDPEAWDYVCVDKYPKWTEFTDAVGEGVEELVEGVLEPAGEWIESKAPAYEQIDEDYQAAAEEQWFSDVDIATQWWDESSQEILGYLRNSAEAYQRLQQERDDAK